MILRSPDTQKPLCGALRNSIPRHEPVVFLFRAPSRLLESQLVLALVWQWANLRSKKNQEKKLAVTIFSFPPDKGNVGTAAYLDVFGSIHTVLSKLKKEVRQAGSPHARAESPAQIHSDALSGGRI